MERKVVVSLIQGGPRSADQSANQAHNLTMIDLAAKARPDFIVFDELSTTPYFGVTRPKNDYFDWAEPIPGEYTRKVGEKARRHKCCIVVPMFENEGAVYHNSAAVLGPDGGLVSGRMPDGSRVRRYAKVHIPKVRTNDTPLDEKPYFASGPGFPVFETPLAKIGVAICFDRRFPEACRTLALQGAEVVFLPGNFPWRNAQSEDIYFAETKTRASENHLYVVACNKAGQETFDGVTTRFIGRSFVAGPDGDVVGPTGPSEEATILTAELDLTRIQSSNERMPFLEERHPRKYVARSDNA